MTIHVPLAAEGLDVADLAQALDGEGVGPDNDSTAGVGLLFSGNIGADWEFRGEKPPLVALAKEFDAALAPYRGGTYINFASVAGGEDVARAVYGNKYDRLVRVKTAYDPTNVFSRGLVDLSDNDGALA